MVLAPPSFINDPAPFKGPKIVKLPNAPPKFKAPVSSIDFVVLVNVRVPASTFILALALIVIVFDKVFDPIVFLIAPVAYTPVPVIEIASGIT